MVHAVDLLSTLPENTHDSAESPRLPGTKPDAVDRLSRLPEKMPDNPGSLCRLPGNLPDNLDTLPGLPENIPRNAEGLSRLQKGRPDNVGVFSWLHENTPDSVESFFARRKKEGNMGRRKQRSGWGWGRRGGQLQGPVRASHIWKLPDDG